MNRNTLNTLFWGILLVAAGAVGLLYNFGALDDYKLLTAYIMAGLLAVAGVGFLVLLAFRRDQTLFVIPGFSFLTLGSIVYLSTLQNVQSVWLGTLFLAGIAAGFLALFLTNRQERWWALLQAGTIAVIALVGLGIGIPEGSKHLLGAALFGGFAVSFLLLFLFAGSFQRFSWALIMAGVLTVLCHGHPQRRLRQQQSPHSALAHPPHPYRRAPAGPRPDRPHRIPTAGCHPPHRDAISSG